MYFCASFFLQVSRACPFHRQIIPHRCQASVRIAEQKTNYIKPRGNHPLSTEHTPPFLPQSRGNIERQSGLPSSRNARALAGSVFRNEDMPVKKQYNSQYGVAYAPVKPLWITNHCSANCMQHKEDWDTAKLPRWPQPGSPGRRMNRYGAWMPPLTGTCMVAGA